MLFSCFRVEQCLNGSAWAELFIFGVMDANQMEYEFRLANSDPYTYYSFRIVANRVEYDKPVEGLPGPASDPIRPLELCIGMHPLCT